MELEDNNNKIYQRAVATHRASGQVSKALEKLIIKNKLLFIFETMKKKFLSE